MKHTYHIEGMTCQGCSASVKKNLLSIDHITDVDVSLEDKTAIITMEKHIDTSTLREALAPKYIITEKQHKSEHPTSPAASSEPSKWAQLKPLFLILSYILVASILIHRNTWAIDQMMLDFMGLFFIVFSFFKLLDVKGFAASFSMYDPLAKLWYGYGSIYPFLETALGLMFLLRWQIPVALVATILILGITTVGVTKTLLSKKTIQCACLGTALDLPMTEATFIENAIMIVMSVAMLLMIIG